MAYEVYIDDMLLPIPPQKIPIKYPGQNETATLINGEEINITRPPGLAEISVDVVLPQMDYPCAMWDGSVEDAEEFISRLQDLKESGDAFEFIIIRDSFDTNMDVTLEDYKVSDDVKEGLDLVVSVDVYKRQVQKIPQWDLGGTELRMVKIMSCGIGLTDFAMN